MRLAKWVIPSMLLLLLIFAFAFRWETGPEKTTSHLTMIFKHDRWTGQDWVRIYYFGADPIVKEVLVNIPFKEPVKPIEPNDSKGFAVFASKLPPINNSDEKNSIIDYQKAIEEYNLKLIDYDDSVARYIGKQNLIKNGLSVLWGALFLANSLWLIKGFKKSDK